MDLFTSIQNFEFIRRKYKDYGATNSEIDDIVEENIESAINGEKYKIPSENIEWGIYESGISIGIGKELQQALIKIIYEILKLKN